MTSKRTRNRGEAMDDDPLYVLDVKWSEGSLPVLVGPFTSKGAADAWGRENVMHGSSVLRTIADPAENVISQ